MKQYPTSQKMTGTVIKNHRDTHVCVLTAMLSSLSVWVLLELVDDANDEVLRVGRMKEGREDNRKDPNNEGV